MDCWELQYTGCLGLLQAVDLEENTKPVGCNDCGVAESRRWPGLVRKVLPSDGQERLRPSQSHQRQQKAEAGRSPPLSTSRSLWHHVPQLQVAAAAQFAA